MAIIDLTSKAVITSLGTVKTMKQTVDMNDVNYGSGDVLQLFDIAIGERVDFVALQVVVIEDSTLTLNAGDGADVNGYIVAANAETLGWNDSDIALASGAFVGYSRGKLYAAADTLDVILSAAGNAGKFHVTAKVTSYIT